ncbi:MAG: hypothetical protein HOH43_07335 [Candidatus Latescibacteria bacterium]|jgi:hypothetical protein|nr:hypothetical protein [Candidatus Latescibacterota bacterium]
MIPLGNAVRIEGYGARTGRSGSVGRSDRAIQFTIPEEPRKAPAKQSCPNCDGRNVRRSRRRVTERCTSWLHPDQRMFRCNRCQHRFWDQQESDTQSATPSRIVQPPTVMPKGVKVASQMSITTSITDQTEETVPFILRLDYWLYRKHSVTLGALIILMMMSGFIFSSVFWALGSFAR